MCMCEYKGILTSTHRAILSQGGLRSLKGFMSHHGHLIQRVLDYQTEMQGKESARRSYHDTFSQMVPVQSARVTHHEILALPLTQGADACLSSGLSLTLEPSDNRTISPSTFPLNIIFCQFFMHKKIILLFFSIFIICKIVMSPTITQWGNSVPV